MPRLDLLNIRTGLHRLFDVPSDHAFDDMIVAVGAASDWTRHAHHRPSPVLASLRRALIPRSPR